MEFKVIFFSMAATLVALFVFTHFYRKKETAVSKLEADYYEKIMALRKSPTNHQLKEQAIMAAKDYASAKGLSEDDIKKMIQQDLPDTQ